MKKWIQLLLGALVSGAFLYWSFSYANMEDLRGALGKVEWLWTVPFVAVTLFTMVVRAWRWRLLLKPAKDIPSRELFSPLMIGFALNGIFPARAGEFARAWLVAKRHEEVSFSGAFATVVVERIFDSVMLLTVIILVFATRNFSGVEGYAYDGRWSAEPSALAWAAAGAIAAVLALSAWGSFAKTKAGSPGRKKALYVLGALALAGALGAWRAFAWAGGHEGAARFGSEVVVNAELLTSLSKKLAVVFGVLLAGACSMLFQPMRTFAERVVLALPLPEGPRDKIVQLLRAFSEGLNSLADWRLVLGALLYTALLWSLVAWTLQIMAWGFPGLGHMTFLDGLALTMLISLAIMVPAAPGYWGLYEAGCVAAIALLGISKDPSLALGYSLVIHSLQMIPIIAIGLAYAAKEHVKPSELVAQADEAEELALDEAEAAARADIAEADGKSASA